MASLPHSSKLPAVTSSARAEASAKSAAVAGMVQVKRGMGRMVRIPSSSIRVFLSSLAAPGAHAPLTHAIPWVVQGNLSNSRGFFVISY